MNHAIARTRTACNLCGAGETVPFWQDKRREFLRCRTCGLVFVPSHHVLSAEEEKKRYDHHQNSPEDADYVRFLGRLAAPLRERIAPGSRGFDFGSGPTPVLSRLFEGMGHAMRTFDRYYAPDPTAFEQQYDFISACEVLEHLQDPGRELERLWSCLKPGGWLGVMTKTLVDAEAFPRWHYKDDPTHICFYSGKTFSWLAERWQAEMVLPEQDVVLFRKR